MSLRWGSATLAIGVLFTLVPSEAWAEGAMLDERTVVERAVKSSALLDAARSDSRAARRAEGAADRARLPDLGVQARYVRLSSVPERFRTLALPGEGGSFTIPQVLDTANVRIVAQVPLTDPFLRLASAAEAAGHAALAKELEERATLVRVELEARTSYLGWVRAGRGVAVAREARDVARAEWRHAETLVTTGISAPSKALPFQTAAAAAESRVVAAETEEAVAAAALRRYLPDETGPFRRASDAPLEAPPNASSLPPAIASLSAAADAEAARARAETWAMFPRLSAFAAIDLSAPSPRAFAASSFTPLATWELGVTLEWSLSSVTTSESGAATARKEAALARVRDARNEWRSTLEATRALVAGARARVPIADETLRVARLAAEQRRGEFRAGVVTSLDVLMAEALLVQAAENAADAELEARLARARLDAVEGRVVSARRALGEAK